MDWKSQLASSIEAAVQAGFEAALQRSGYASVEESADEAARRRTSWFGEAGRRRIEREEDRVRRDPVWAEKMARRHAAFPLPSTATPEPTPSTTSVGIVPEPYCFNPEPVTAISSSPSHASALSACVVRDGDFDLTSPITCSTQCPGRDITMSVFLGPVATSASSKATIGVIPEHCYFDPEQATVASTSTVSPSSLSMCVVHDVDTDTTQPITCSTECPEGDKGAIWASPAPSAITTSVPSACVLLEDGIHLAAPGLQPLHLTTLTTSLVPLSTDLLVEPDSGRSDIGTAFVSQVLHDTTVTTLADKGTATPQGAQGLLSMVEIQLAIINALAITLEPVAMQPHGMLDMFISLSRRSFPPIIEKSAAVQKWISHYIQGVVLASWNPQLQYCSVGDEYSHGYENFPWIIAWSLSYHYSLSRHQILPAFAFLLLQQNSPIIYKELWFRFLIGFRIDSYLLCSRLGNNCFLAERFVFEHWLIQGDPGDVPVQHFLRPTRPRDPTPDSRPVAMIFSYVLVVGHEFHSPWDPGGCNHGSCHYRVLICLHLVGFGCLRRQFPNWKRPILKAQYDYECFDWEIAWYLVESSCDCSERGGNGQVTSKSRLFGYGGKVICISLLHSPVCCMTFQSRRYNLQISPVGILFPCVLATKPLGVLVVCSHLTPLEVTHQHYKGSNTVKYSVATVYQVMLNRYNSFSGWNTFGRWLLHHTLLQRCFPSSFVGYNIQYLPQLIHWPSVQLHMSVLAQRECSCEFPFCTSWMDRMVFNNDRFAFANMLEDLQLSWDPSVQKFCHLFTQSEAKGRTNVAALAYCRYHRPNHACFFDEVCADRDYHLDIFCDQVHISNDYYIFRSTCHDYSLGVFLEQVRVISYLNLIKISFDYNALRDLGEFMAHQVPWDPGDSTWHRLEVKPKFKEGGMLATYPTATTGLGLGCYYWAWTAGRHDATATNILGRDTSKLAWNGTDLAFPASVFFFLLYFSSFLSNG